MLSVESFKTPTSLTIQERQPGSVVSGKQESVFRWKTRMSSGLAGRAGHRCVPQLQGSVPSAWAIPETGEEVGCALGPISAAPLEVWARVPGASGTRCPVPSHVLSHS